VSFVDHLFILFAAEPFVDSPAPMVLQKPQESSSNLSK